MKIARESDQKCSYLSIFPDQPPGYKLKSSYYPSKTSYQFVVILFLTFAINDKYDSD